MTHRKKWIQHFHGALDGREDSPTQNWVELKGEEGNEWEGLEGAMDRLIGDDEYAQRIAENAVRSMRDRYLTPASITCYWRRVLAEYAVRFHLPPCALLPFPPPILLPSPAFLSANSSLTTDTSADTANLQTRPCGY